MTRFSELTNATKAQIITAINAILVLVTAFGFSLTSNQIAAITAASNAVLSLWIGLTYKDSPKRVPDT